MKSVLITGGSEGIGLAFAKEYAKQNCCLFLVARNEERLKNVQHELQKEFHISVEIFAIDLAKPKSGQLVYERYKDCNIDVLINNAGCGLVGNAISIDLQKDEEMMYLNMNTLVVLTKLFGKQMVQKRSGIILNVSSTAAFQPGPHMASYYASKSFVLNYTRAFQDEVKQYGVKVFCLCPGPVDTAFYQKSGSHMSRYHLSAQICVSYAMKHMKNKTIIIPGTLNKVLYYLPSEWKMKWLSKNKK